MSGGRSQAGEVVEERREEIITVPAGHGHGPEVIEKQTYERRELSPPRIHYGRSRSAGPAPIIVDTHGPVEIIETNRGSAGPLVLLDNRGRKRNGDLVVYEERREREHDGGVIIKKDKKGRMSIVVPRN
jgi:hypothetical protein